MALHYNSRIVTNGLALHIDAANLKSYPGSGTTWFDLKGNTDFTLVNPTYYSYDSANNGSFDFNRTLPPDVEDGAYATATGTGNLTSLAYLGNNHTTEVWARINSRVVTNYNSTELTNALFVYRGFHAMFYFNTGVTYYGVWGLNATGGWSVNNASFSDTTTGVWQHLMCVRESNSLRLYLNGVLKNTTTITVDSSSTPTTSNIRISTANDSSGNYSWNADVNVSIARMYTRALSENEILQNFEAQRGRYGI